MSDTPRTDALQDSGHAHYMSLQLARTLERELAAAKEMHIAAVRRLDEVCRDRDAWADGFRKWTAYAERLEKAGDTLATVTLRNGRSHEQWHAAKETKP